MQFATRRVNDICVVDLDGSLDSHAAGPIGDRLMDLARGADRRVLLNLEKVTYVSSAGLRIILRAASQLQSRHGDLRLCAPKATVYDVMQTAGFDSLLKVYEYENDAVAAFGL